MLYKTTDTTHVKTPKAGEKPDIYPQKILLVKRHEILHILKWLKKQVRDRKFYSTDRSVSMRHYKGNFIIFNEASGKKEAPLVTWTVDSDNVQHNFDISNF